MKRMIPTLLFLLTLGLLAGCAVGPDYKRPDLSVPGSYRYEVKDASDTANTEWWRQFEDPVLDALIDEALANNKNVKISAAKIEQGGRAAHPDPIADLPAAQLQRYRRAAATHRVRRDTPVDRRPQPADGLPGPGFGELGDRSLGPHPPADRVGSGKPAGHGVCKAGRGPLARRLRRQLLPAAARTG